MVILYGNKSTWSIREEEKEKKIAKYTFLLYFAFHK